MRASVFVLLLEKQKAPFQNLLDQALIIMDQHDATFMWKHKCGIWVRLTMAEGLSGRMFGRT